MEWLVSLRESSTTVSQLAAAGSGQGSAVLLVLVLVVLTAIHRISDVAPASRLSVLAQGVDLVMPPLVVGFVVAIALSVANAIR
ncbi:MAG: hypothetical protein U0893_08440 [Chloroflexota bacterium]